MKGVAERGTLGQWGVQIGALQATIGLESSMSATEHKSAFATALFNRLCKKIIVKSVSVDSMSQLVVHRYTRNTQSCFQQDLG